MDVAEEFRVLASHYGHTKPALIVNDEPVSFARIEALADFLASMLKKFGVGRGDIVAVELPNSLEYVVAYFAVMKLGSVFLCIDPRIQEEEREVLFEDAKPKVWLFDPEKEQKESLRRQKQGEVRTLPFKLGSPLLLETELQNKTPIESEPAYPEDPALIFYTSGSTGKPKGVVLPRRSLNVFPEFCSAIFGCQGELSNQVLGVGIPMSHLGGPIYCNMLARYGTSLVIVEPFRPDRFLKAIERHRITGFHSVPPILASLLQVPERETFDLSSLSWIAPMGMAVPKPLLLELKSAFPSAHILQGYGMTETAGPLIAVPFEYETKKLGSMGRLLVEGCQMSLVDEEGREVPEMETGEIVVSGKCLMKGYRNRPELNDRVFKDGFFFTGDLAYRDSEGFFYFMGRKDDLINIGGEKVYPAEIEAALLFHPKVAEACVLGIDSPKRGKTIKAFVRLFQGERLDQRELLQFLGARLSRYKIPQEVSVVDMLPRTSSGKIAKAELSRMTTKESLFLASS